MIYQKLILLYLLFINFINTKIITSNQYQTGQDKFLFEGLEGGGLVSTVKDATYGPFVKVSKVLFEKPFDFIPEVSISYKYLYFTSKVRKDYTTHVRNITAQGFEIIYTTETKNQQFLGVINWFAFDPSLGEVIDVELKGQEEVGNLMTWFSAADEHRVETHVIKYKKQYSRPPRVTSYILGCLNDGPEWVISSNTTEVQSDQLILLTNAWHHSEVEYVKYQLLILDATLNCQFGFGKDYTWTELKHAWYPHPWNQLQKVNYDKDGRYTFYNYQVSEYFIQEEYKKFVITGFTGYEISEGNFSANITEPEYMPKNQTLSMLVGVHGNTQMRGAWWSYLICNNDQLEDKPSLIRQFYESSNFNTIMLSFGVTILLGLIFLYFFIDTNSLQEDIRVQQMQELKDKKNQ